MTGSSRLETLHTDLPGQHRSSSSASIAPRDLLPGARCLTGNSTWHTSLLRSARTAFVAILLLLWNPGHGQQQQSAPYTLRPGTEGTVSHGYRLAKGDTVLHGDWRFSFTKRDTSDRYRIKGIEINGSFDQGIRTGTWQYSAKELHIEDSPELKGFQVVKNTSGTEHQVVASFAAGKADGPWRMVEQRIANGSPIDTLHQVEASFTEGTLHGSVIGLMGATAIHATFNKQGLAHGDWRFEHRTPKGASLVEHRNYAEGQLRQHRFEQGRERAAVVYAGNESGMEVGTQAFADLELGPGALRVMTFTGRATGLSETLGSAMLDSLVRRSNAALLEALLSLVEDDGHGIWKMPAGSEAPVLGLIRLPLFPFSKDEEPARGKLKDMHREATRLIVQFFSDPLTDLGRHAYEDIEAYHTIMEVYRVRLDQLHEVLSVMEDPMCVHLDRIAFLRSRTPAIEFPSQVFYNFKEEERERPHAFPKPLLPDGMSLMALEEHLGAVLKDLKDIRRKVDTILDRYKTRSQLVEKEERLVRKRDSVLTLYGNTAGRDDFNPYHERLAAGMQQLVMDRFKEYAGLDQDGKVERIEPLLACFNEAIDVYHKQVRTPLRIERLNEIYTRNIWNPHTFTYMDERIKERIYRAYESTLLPRVLKDMEDNVECGKLLGKQQNLVKLYQKMLELREQDTRAIDRQLRRGMEAEEIMRIMELELDLDR